MYIYPSSPESESFLQSEESAAIKIQAGFRGYRVRKQLYRISKSNSSRNIGQRFGNQQASGGRRQQRQQRSHIYDSMEDNQKQIPKANDVSALSDANSVEARSAIKIQAGFRGFLVRKKQKIATDAAVKIQSSFRGFKARKETEKLKQS
ncbi:abnormal spindle-like microcephaly-associated protein homolog [Drosophila hydei]|uniref:Abnormal spindle-like microcephaly-associated protein homolog n=1 Tax=Drosophila hydei TaxID=7224 RepID=A0A6J1M9M7_DROHY|nr:abnormal spindle-like microcephaly-associated protein homolog [Drosophila hydei]